jgi:predicted RNA-binding Zn ribbon-like protein
VTGGLSAIPALISAVREDACLAFANTLSWRGRDAPVERLVDVAALLGWAEEGGAIPPVSIRRFARRAAAMHPAYAIELLAEAIALREAIHTVFAATTRRNPAPARDFAALSRAVSEAPARQRLVRSNGGHGWQIELWPADRTAPAAAALLAPVLWSAADLLVGAHQERIRECANAECLWLFLDESKGGTRRWCDMAACGNRAKARRHYLKVRGG